MKRFRIIIAMLIALSMTINSVNISYGGGPSEEGNKEQDTIESDNKILEDCINQVLYEYSQECHQISNEIRSKLSMESLNENEKPKYAYDKMGKVYEYLFKKIKSQFNLREKDKCEFESSITFIYQLTNNVIKKIHEHPVKIDGDNCISDSFKKHFYDGNKFFTYQRQHFPRETLSKENLDFIYALKKQKGGDVLKGIFLSDDIKRFQDFLDENPECLNTMNFNGTRLIDISARLGAEEIFNFISLQNQDFNKVTCQYAVCGGNIQIIKKTEGYIKNKEDIIIDIIIDAIRVGEINICRYLFQYAKIIDYKFLREIIYYAWETCNMILLEAVLSNFPIEKQIRLSERGKFSYPVINNFIKCRESSDIIEYFFKKGRFPTEELILEAMKKGNEWLMNAFKSIPNYGEKEIVQKFSSLYGLSSSKYELLDNFKDQRVSDYIDFLKNIGDIRCQVKYNGNTLLHLAVINRELDAINTLLSNQLDQYKLNLNGLFPISIALANNDESIIVAMLKNILKDENIARSAYEMLLELQKKNLEKANTILKTLPEGTLLEMADIIINFAVYKKDLQQYVNFLVDNNVSLETILKNGETILQATTKLPTITQNLKDEEIKYLIDYCRGLGLNFNVMNDNGGLLLLTAIKNKNAGMVKFLLEKGVDPNQKISFEDESLSPLYWTIRSESAEVLSELLSAGADIYEKDRYENSALIDAVCYLNKSAVKVFLEKDFNPNEERTYNGSALCIAISGKTDRPFKENIAMQKEIITLLLEKGANINQVTCSGEIPWITAFESSGTVMKTFIGCLKKIDKNFDFNAKLFLGSTWLHWLVINSTARKMKVLIDNGKKIDVNIFDDSKETPLSLAVTKNQTDKAMLLLENGANPNKFHVEPILIKAISNKNVEIVKLLLKYGADTNLLGSDKISSLVCAVNNPNPEIIQSLIEKGVNIEIPEDKFENLTSIANYQKSNGIMNLILYRFKELPLKYLRQVFMLLILKGSLNDLECFLSNQKVDINVSEKGRLSLLSIAVKGNQIDKVKVLLEKGADTTNYNGIQALNQAIFNKNVEIVNLLLQHGININLFANERVNPLVTAVEVGNLEIIQNLIQNSAKIEVPQACFRDLLLKAFSQRNEEIIQLLVERYGELPANYKQLLVDEMTSKGEIGDLKKIFFKEVKNSRLVSKALCVAIKNDNAEKVNFLVRYCHAIYYNYLNLAIDVGNIKIITTLLDADKKGLLLKSQDGLRCFFYAVKKQDEQNGQNKQVITLFLNKGIDINKKNEYDISAYMLAENQDTKDFLELNGADKVELEITDKYIEFITFFCSNDRTKRLLKSLDVSKLNSLISKLLDTAIKRNDLDKISLLLSPETYNDSDLQNTNTVNALDYINKNLLKYIYGMSKECLKILLNKGLGIEQIDSEGNSALHILCESFKRAYSEKKDNIVKNEIDKITLLVEKGCDINIKNKKGQTCWDIVNDTVKDDITEYLESKNGLRTYDKMIRLLMYNYQKIDSLLNILNKK